MPDRGHHAARPLVGIVQANVRLRLRSSLDRYRLAAVRASSAGVAGAPDGLAVGRRRIGS